MDNQRFNYAIKKSRVDYFKLFVARNSFELGKLAKGMFNLLEKFIYHVDFT